MLESCNLFFVHSKVSPFSSEETHRLQKLKEDGIVEQPDMVLIDHVEELYIQEFQTLERLGMLRVGATIVADNVVRPGAPESREFVRGHGRLESKGVLGLITPGDFEVRITLMGFDSNADLILGRVRS